MCFFPFVLGPGKTRVEQCSCVFSPMLYKYTSVTIIVKFHISFDNLNRVEDAVIRYLNRKPAAGSDAPGST